MATILKYWDEAAGEWKVFTGDVPAPTASIVVKGAVLGTVDGVNNAFNTGAPYVAGTLQAYVNGSAQSNSVLETDPLTGAFTFDEVVPSGSNIRVYFHVANTGLGNTDTVDNFHANAVPTANNLLPLDNNAKYPSSVLDVTLKTTVGTNGNYFQIGELLICTGFDSVAFAGTGITFAKPFAATPVVVTTTQDPHEQNAWVSARSTTGATLKQKYTGGNLGVNWIAIGRAA